MSTKHSNDRKKAKRKYREQIIAEQDGRCHLCGHRHVLTLHHVIAFEDGGENVRSNIVGLCLKCHYLWHGVGDGCKDGPWKPLNGWCVSDGPKYDDDRERWREIEAYDFRRPRVNNTRSRTDHGRAGQLSHKTSVRSAQASRKRGT